MTRIGTALSIADPVMAELAAQALDLVWIDLEHGALSSRDAQVLALAVQSTGALAYVRVPSGRFDALPAILDAGVDGVVVPCVESAATAREMVRRMSLPPGPRRAGGYGRSHEATARPACVVQIESPAGLARVRDIAAVPGVDCLVLGCAGLAAALGIERRLDTPELAQAAETVADAAERYGVGFGIAGTGPARQVASLAAGRAEFVLVGADVRLYAAGVDAQADALRAALEAVRAAA